MRVIATSGGQCPQENPRAPSITDGAAVDVPDTAYYLRRIADGSLIHAVQASAPAAVEQSGASASGNKTKKGAAE